MTVPQPAPAVIDRRRLVERLLDGPRPPLASITAPAGWGKTTLAAEVARLLLAAGERVAWLSVEDRTGAHAFVGDLLAALCLASPELDHGLRDVVVPPSASDLTAVIDRVATTMSAAREPLTIVFDDVHLLTDKDARRCLERLIGRPTPTVHVILAARREPGLPMSRWRMAQILTDLRVDDLAATRAESRSLLDRFGVLLTDDELDTLTEATEGWIGGIGLAARTLAASDDPTATLAGITGVAGHRDLADYLIEQVLSGFPQATHEFLQDISVVNPIPVGLAARLGRRPDAAQILRDVAHQTGFIAAVDRTEATFRVHHLLSATLRYELGAARADRRRRLHREAAQWYLDQDQPLAAMEQYILAHAWSDTAELLVASLTGLTFTGHAPQVRRLLSQIPRSVIHADPVLAAAVVAMRSWTGEFREMDDLFSAIAAAENGAVQPLDPGRRSWVGFIRLITMAARDRFTGPEAPSGARCWTATGGPPSCGSARRPWPGAVWRRTSARPRRWASGCPF